MSRFRKLELEPTVTTRARVAVPPQLRDHRWQVAAAMRCWHRARFERALRHFGRALEHEPNHREAWLGQVRMLLELGESHEADVWAGKALELFPDEPDLLSARAVAIARGGDPKAALDACDLATRRPGGSAYRWLARGEVLLAGRRARHVDCFGRAQAGRPGDWLTRLESARVYIRYDRPVQASTFVEQALDVTVAEPFVWHTRAEVHRRLGRREAARVGYRRALRLDPEFRPADLALASLGAPSVIGRLLRRLGRSPCR